MLPVSYEFPSTPPLSYKAFPGSYIPSSPYKEIEGIEHLVVTEIVSKASLHHSKNPLRMFCYNLLCENNWYNQYFEEVSQLTYKYIKRLMRDTAVSAVSLYVESVENVLSLFTSDLLYRFPELRSVITPQLLEASSQNAGLLHHLKTENVSMSSPPGQPHPYGYNPSMHPAQAGYHTPNMMPMNQGYGHQPHPQQPVLVYHPQFGMVPYQGPVLQQPMVQHPNAFQQYRQPMSHEDLAPRPQHEVSRSYDHRVIKSYGGAPDIQPGQEFDIRQRVRYDRNSAVELSPEHQPYDATSKQTIQTGDSKVDRSKHELEVVTNTLTLTQQERIKVIKDTKEIEISESVMSDLEINVLIAQLHTDCIVDIKRSKKINRVYAVIPSVVISSENLETELEHLQNSNSLIKFSKYLSGVINNMNAECPELRVSLIRQIDNKLTERINLFIKHELSLLDGESAQFEIQSFMEDFPELPRYILKRFGQPGVSKLERFEKRFLESFKTELMKTTFKDLSKLIVLENAGGGAVNMEYIPYTYSITRIPLDRVDLGIPNAEGVVRLEDKKDDMLINALKPLVLGNDPQNLFSHEIDYHILVTRDDMRYRVSSLNENIVLIRM